MSEPLDSGRVVNREALLPEGTRPGVSAGIPPGWTAVRLTSLQVRGLGMANELDHIELVATRPIRAEHAQAKAEWPAIRSDAVFTVPDSEDVFTQADVRVLATDAIVLTRAVEDVEVAVVDEEETALDEAEVGESVNRKSIVRKKTPRYVTRSAVVCSVAVPAEVVTALTEALTIQSIVGDGAGNDGAAGSDGAADGDDTSQSGAGGQRTDNEVAIFAVVRSSNPEAAAERRSDTRSGCHPELAEGLEFKVHPASGYGANDTDRHDTGATNSRRDGRGPVSLSGSRYHSAGIIRSETSSSDRRSPAERRPVTVNLTIRQLSRVRSQP